MAGATIDQDAPGWFVDLVWVEVGSFVVLALAAPVLFVIRTATLLLGLSADPEHTTNMWPVIAPLFGLIAVVLLSLVLNVLVVAYLLVVELSDKLKFNCFYKR